MKRPPYVCQYWTADLPENTALPEHLAEIMRFWSVRSCGLACASSALALLAGQVVSVQSLFNRCVSTGGYSEKGWRHEQLAQTLSAYGLDASARALTVDKVIDILRGGQLVIASVTHQFPCDGRRGGHLVLLYSVRNLFGTHFICFMDPTRWGERHHAVPVARFSSSFSMKGIVISDKVN